MGRIVLATLLLLPILLMTGCDKRKVWESQSFESDGIEIIVDLSTEYIDEEVYFYITITPAFDKLPNKEFSMALTLFNSNSHHWVDFPYEVENDQVIIELKKPVEDVDERVKVKWQNTFRDWEISFSGVIWRN